jgi:[protein-PII] uridylyltransferase
VKRKHESIAAGPFLLEGQRLHFLKPDLIAKCPRLLMQFFWLATESGAHFDHQAGDVIRRNSKALTERDRRDPEVVKQFFDILLHPRHAFPVLKAMLETGFLQAFIPEFSGVRYRMQDHVYHLYTVDEHQLRTVEQMHRMELHPEHAPIRLPVDEIFDQLKNRRVLYLAALIHDLGKSQGKNHWLTGSHMATDIALRLGLSTRETALLCFLIKNHLLLNDTALERDLNDEKTVLSCANKLADRETLRMLFLLAIADSCATGPRAWNSWKASLFSQLYMKLDQILLHRCTGGQDV